MMGFGIGGMVFGLLMMIGILLLILLGIWALVRWLSGTHSQPRVSPGDHKPVGGGSRAREILEERYTRGEISTDEYLDMLHTLGQ